MEARRSQREKKRLNIFRQARFRTDKDPFVPADQADQGCPIHVTHMRFAEIMKSLPGDKTNHNIGFAGRQPEFGSDSFLCGKPAGMKIGQFMIARITEMISAQLPVIGRRRQLGLYQGPGKSGSIEPPARLGIGKDHMGNACQCADPTAMQGPFTDNHIRIKTLENVIESVKNCRKL